MIFDSTGGNSLLAVASAPLAHTLPAALLLFFLKQTPEGRKEVSMKFNDLTLGEIKELKKMFKDDSEVFWAIGRRCIVRTYSAGVHIGKVVWVNPNNHMECKLEDGLRLWKWEDGGLSLSAVAENGIKGGRLNREKEIGLTNAIEYIPTTLKAEETYVKFIED